MTLKTQITAILANFLPTKTRTVIRGKQQPQASAHLMDVDLLHSYLRSAEQGDTERLFGLYRDLLAGHAHTQGQFNTRKLAVLGEPLTFTPKNPDDAAESAWVAQLQKHFDDRPGLMDFLSHSLDATMYPVAISERTYQPSALPGWRYELGAILPVPHLHLAWPYGELSIRETDEDGNFLGTFSKPSPMRYICHRGHLLSSVPDYWGGPMRALLFWWLFATMDRDWWARFLDRFGSPFLVGKYNEADDDARYTLESAFSAATRLFGLAISKDTDVSMHQANSSGGGEAFLQFHTTANDEISKLIVGQPGSSSSTGPKIGGDGQASAQSEVREDIKKYDSARLAHTIRTQILAPLKAINGWTWDLPSVSFGVISEEEADLTGNLLESLYAAGIEPDDEGLKKVSKKLGISLRRIPALPPAPGLALSARPSLPLIPSVARRAARQQQARGAVEALAAGASPKLARLMRDRALELAAAIESADSPEAAASAVATLAAAYDPGSAAELVTGVLTSAAVNAVLATD
jgi:phage gp29-like protein